MHPTLLRRLLQLHLRPPLPPQHPLLLLWARQVQQEDSQQHVLLESSQEMYERSMCVPV